MKDTEGYSQQYYSSLGMMGKWSCYTMFQSDKKDLISSVTKQYLAVRNIRIEEAFGSTIKEIFNK